MASAIANVIFALTFVLASLYVWLLWPRAAASGPMSFASATSRAGRAPRAAIAWPCALRRLVGRAGRVARSVERAGAAGADRAAARISRPHNFTLDNFVTVIGAAAALGRGIVNSLIVALFSTALALVLGRAGRLCAGAPAVPRANSISFLILATQMLPGIAIAIPLFITISQLGLIDNVLSLGVVYLSFNLPIVIWILRGFFMGIPAGIEKAAAVDGAGVLATFWHIILPISLPPLERGGGLRLRRGVERVLLRADPDAPVRRRPCRW